MIWDRTNRPVWLRCTVAVLAVVVAAAIRLQFLEILGLRATFLTFYPAVALAALYGGFAPGLLATAVSAALADYFWLEPVGQFAIANRADLISMVIFLASCTLISYLAEAAYSVQARAHKAEEESKLAAEREKAAAGLQQSEAKYRELVQNANSAIIRWKQDGTIAFINEYAQKIFGYSADEIVGKSVNILLPERESTGGDLTRLVQDVVNNPERYANNINENILRDGGRVWMAWTNKPIFDHDGQLLEILAVGSDITGRKRMEEALRGSEDRFRALVQTTSDVVYRMSPNWDRMHQLRGRDFIPDTETPSSTWLQTYIHPDDQPLVIAAINKAIRNKSVFELEHRVVRVDGSLGWTFSRAIPLQDENGEIVEWFGTASNITERKQAEVLLQRQAELLHLSYDAIIVWRLGGFIESWNKGAEELYGYSQEEAVGQVTHDLLKTVHPAPFSKMEAWLRERKFWEGELKHHTRDGREIIVSARHQLVRGADGVERVLEINRDITDRKRAEERLREYEKAVEGLEEMITVVDRDYRYLIANRAFLNYRDMERGQVVGSLVPEVLDRDVFEKEIKEKLDECFQGNIIKYEMKYSYPKLGDRDLLISYFPIESPAGIDRVACVLRDITERKRGEARVTADLAALTRMHALSGRVLETGGLQPLLKEIMEAAVAVAGAEMGFLQLLKNDSLRIVANHGHRQPFLQFFASAENEASVCGEAARRGKRVIVSDVETSSLFIGTPSLPVLREAGVRAVQSTPVISRSGALLGILTTHWGVPYNPDEHDLWRIDLLVRQAADLIEHSRTEEALRKSRDELELRVQQRTTELNSYMGKLEKSNQALQDFASIAAHDMKEPLRKVVSFGNMLRQKSGDSLGQTESDYLDRMINATERMQSLLTGLLDYSRVTTEGEPFKPVDLSGLIGEVLSDLEVTIVKTGGKVHVGTLPVISADPMQMRQLFQNLIGNALKFHKPDERPVVHVRSVSDTGSGCRIVVEDNGIGFEEQYRDRIFAPFQRLRGRSEYEGTGMGLAICKKIVERHGGSITAKSTPGAGSTFIIELP